MITWSDGIKRALCGAVKAEGRAGGMGVGRCGCGCGWVWGLEDGDLG